MKSTKSALLSLTCGSLSLIVLSGCPNAGTQPPLNASASPSAPAASIEPAASPTTAASATPTGASAAPSATPSSSPLKPATVSGKVYDEAGGTVNGAKVRVRSLNSASPFDSTVDVANGAYVVNEVPAGVQVEVTVTKAGWTTRSRVEALLPNETANNIYNFGGTSTSPDANGPNFFVSNYPEVTSAASTYTDGKLTWTLRFSEALSADDRNRLVDAISITTPDPSGNGNFITIKTGSLFLTEANQAIASWDAANTTLTVTFNAALLTSKDKERTYTLRFNRGTSDALIADPESKTFGFVAAAAPGSYDYAFKRSSLVISNQTTAEDRWKATHQSSASLELPKDDVSPKLASVATSPLSFEGTEYTRVTLTFSEPMTVYPQVRSTTLDDLANNYIFAVTDDKAANIDMAGTLGTSVTAANDIQLGVPFKFTVGSNAKVRYSTTDPKVVFFDIPRTLIPASGKEIKVRVNSIQDPAGNTVATGNSVTADKTADNIKFSTLR